MPLTQTITIALSYYWHVGELGVGQLRNLGVIIALLYVSVEVFLCGGELFFFILKVLQP